MTYVTTGSPDVGALHVSVTELPLDVAVRPLGAPGAVAPAVVTRAIGRAPEKHAASATPLRQRAKSTDDVIDRPEAADGAAAAALIAIAVREGAEGDDDPPLQAAEHSAVVVITTTAVIALVIASPPPAVIVC
jgi:hypothetical protein